MTSEYTTQPKLVRSRPSLLPGHCRDTLVSLRNVGTAVFVLNNGGSIFVVNDLWDNAGGAWEIEPCCELEVQRSGNKE